MRLLFIFCLIIPALQCAAQLNKAEAISKMEERSFLLIEMYNGDLVPFAKTDDNNKDIYLENGKPVRIIHLGFIENDTLGYTQIFYYGDSVILKKQYDNKGRYKSYDSAYYVNGEIKSHFTYYYRAGGTEELEEQYYSLDSTHSGVVIKKAGEPDQELQIVNLAADKFINIVLEQGREISRDTTTVFYTGKRIRKAVFRTDKRTSFTRDEYALDAYGNWTSRMSFYNTEEIADHVDCTLRKIYYTGKPDTIAAGREAFFGYWVSLDGNTNYLFKPNGKVDINRDPFKKQYFTCSWFLDAQRQAPCIILTEAARDHHPGDVVEGNRLYFTYAPRQKQLRLGGLRCTQRPVLKRQK